MIDHLGIKNFRIPSLRGLGLSISLLISTGCSRAPSFDIIGSFFPAWLVCVLASLILTLAVRWLFLRLGVVLALPVLTYPSLAALIALALWLAFFL